MQQYNRTMFSIILSFRMFRAIPVSNKVCFDKQVKRSWKIHQQKLNQLKSTLSQEKPEKFDFLEQRQKKVALMQVRNMEINRQNGSLMKRMKEIDSKQYKTSYTRLYQDLSDHKKKTLNEPYRKRELLKVVEENQEILKRLQHKRSQYSVKKMEQHRKLVEKNISLISQFPFKNYPNSHTPVNLWATSDSFHTRSLSHPHELEFTFKGQRTIQDASFQITTYLSKGNFYLQMEGVEDRREKYRIQLPEQQARDLLRVSYSSSIQRMISHLNIDRDKQMCFLRYSAPAPQIEQL